jgi:nucleoside-diphosphate-sugar epimerase
MNKDAPVLVTGATGFVAAWIVKKLLEEGFTVHAAVRNPDNEEKVAHLNEMAAEAESQIKYFKADLLDEGSYAEAMQGCEVVFHTASPFTLDVDDPVKELIEPAEKGTANVLNQATQTPSVKKVVVTSSCAAIYTDAIDTQNAPNGEITEDLWNTTASVEYQPYSYSKTLAEKKAWEIADAQEQWQLVTINPSFVMGPALNKGKVSSESYNILQQLGDGTMKAGVPKMGIGMVDVRDVAEAHFQAAFNPKAQGRYITSAHNTNFLEMAESLQEKFGADYPIPKKALPKWLLWLVGPFINKSFSRKMISNNVNIPFTANNQKIREELDLHFLPLQKTMEDSFRAAIEKGMV